MPTSAVYHRPSVKIKKTENRKSACKRGYNRNWSHARLMYLRANPFCKNCGKAIDDPSKFVVDHIDAVSGPDDPMFWDEWNWRVLCASCHSVKTCLCDGGFGRPKVKYSYLKAR